MHMNAVNVTEGAIVISRTAIGTVGDTGNSNNFTATRCHVHFDVRYKAPPEANPHTHVDPFLGDCNWITQSLWLNVDMPSCE